MFFRKKKEEPPTPVCVHDWHLVNMHSTTDQWGTTHLYILGCTKCNVLKKLDEYEYNKFLEHFDVKNRKENE